MINKIRIEETGQELQVGKVYKHTYTFNLADAVGNVFKGIIEETKTTNELKWNDKTEFVNYIKTELMKNTFSANRLYFKPNQNTEIGAKQSIFILTNNYYGEPNLTGIYFYFSEDSFIYKDLVGAAYANNINFIDNLVSSFDAIVEEV